MGLTGQAVKVAPSRRLGALCIDESLDWGPLNTPVPSHARSGRHKSLRWTLEVGALRMVSCPLINVSLVTCRTLHFTAGVLAEPLEVEHEAGESADRKSDGQCV